MVKCVVNILEKSRLIEAFIIGQMDRELRCRWSYWCKCAITNCEAAEWAHSKREKWRDWWMPAESVTFQACGPFPILLLKLLPSSAEEFSDQSHSHLLINQTMQIFTIKMNLDKDPTLSWLPLLNLSRYRQIVDISGVCKNLCEGTRLNIESGCYFSCSSSFIESWLCKRKT